MSPLLARVMFSEEADLCCCCALACVFSKALPTPIFTTSIGPGRWTRHSRGRFVLERVCGGRRTVATMCLLQPFSVVPDPPLAWVLHLLASQPHFLAPHQHQNFHNRSVPAQCYSTACASLWLSRISPVCRWGQLLFSCVTFDFFKCKICTI